MIPIKNLVTRNYNVPKTVRNLKKPTAEFKRLSVAVMVDGNRVPHLDEDGEVMIMMRDANDTI
jgi:flagellar M-ring protein FliF